MRRSRQRLLTSSPPLSEGRHANAERPARCWPGRTCRGERIPKRRMEECVRDRTRNGRFASSVLKPLSVSTRSWLYGTADSLNRLTPTYRTSSNRYGSHRYGYAHPRRPDRRAAASGGEHRRVAAFRAPHERPRPSTRHTESARFFDVVGRRSAVFGYENRAFEAWVYPLKLVDDFRLSFRLQGYPLEIQGDEHRDRDRGAPGGHDLHLLARGLHRAPDPLRARWTSRAS